MVAIKIIIADDHNLFREGLSYVLSLDSSISIIDEAANGQELIEKVSANTPDIVLLDMHMPIMNGIESMQRIRVTHPAVKFIILSMNEHEIQIADLVERGCNGYLSKFASAEEVISTIKKVMEQEYYFNEHIHMIIHKRLAHKESNQSGFPVFSEKELQIIKCICKELTTDEISREVNLSPRTIEGYRSKIIQKMNVKTIAGVVKYAIENNLLNR